MKLNHPRIVIALFILLVAAGCLAADIVGPYFSPRGGCTEAIVKEIDSAKKTVLLQAFSFTSPPIAEALVAADKRGVDVRAILDKGQPEAQGSQWPLLVRARIPVSIDGQHAIAHNKVMVIDGQTVITGSFNFTTSAEERNAENLLIIKDKTIAEVYAANWRQHAAHSEAIKPRESLNATNRKPNRGR